MWIPVVYQQGNIFWSGVIFEDGLLNKGMMGQIYKIKLVQYCNFNNWLSKKKKQQDQRCYNGRKELAIEIVYTYVEDRQ